MRIKKYTIELDEYEVANLRTIFEAAGYWASKTKVPRNPLCALDTGDWFGQVYNKLPEVEYTPNVSARDLVTLVYLWDKVVNLTTQEREELCTRKR